VTGSLVIVGTGPGKPELITPATRAALAEADDLVGYGPYLDRVPQVRGQSRHASDNRVELDRARQALALAAAGRKVVVVSGGDPGVFAMAAAVFEAVESGEAAWQGLDIRVEPGVTSMLAAAAEVGAPLGGDFCAISLSDNLKSWTTIERRLKAAAEADFVIALYNPASKARPHQLADAFALLRTVPARRESSRRPWPKLTPPKPTCAPWSSSGPARRIASDAGFTRRVEQGHEASARRPRLPSRRRRRACAAERS